VKQISGRPKSCKACKRKFVPTRTFQTWCSPDCGVKLAMETRTKEKRQELKQKRETLKTRGDWLKEAQIAFNAWIRERDYSKPCISCNANKAGQWDASHYRSVGACPALRFEPDNVHKACSVCNQHHSGRVIEYRIALVKLLGAARVEWLEQEHAPIKLTSDEIKEIKSRYSRMARELKKARESNV